MASQAPPHPKPAVPADLAGRIRARALELGFDVVAFARADVPLETDHARYVAFVAAGMHGEMAWLAENEAARLRVDRDTILEGARTVVCVARRYQRPSADEALDPPFARLVARYARGRDYHNFLRKKLRRLAAFARTLGEGVQARPMCDDAPVLERAWAARAGLGFIGKNGLLIVPGQGSFLLLGEVVTTLDVEAPAFGVPLAERCGSCTRCLDACPTDAFAAPWILDARRCVSYLTIEHRSSIDEGLRAGIGEHLFGCDDCQTVCPFNASPRARAEDAAVAFRPHDRWGSLELVALLEADDEAFRALTEGSPLSRAMRDGLARNAAIVLGNRGDEDALPALERAAREHASPIVRDAAAWAALQISSSCART